jgi:hypothetical protein
MPLSSSDLIVEDGSVVADANAYVTLDFCDAYHLLRANDDWASAAEAEKVAAIINATDYVNARWAFVSTRSDEAQALEWPRDKVTDANGFDQADNVPLVVQQTTAEYALRALAGALLPDPAQDDNGKFITLKREKVGPVEEETRYSELLGRSVLKPYPMADRRMSASGLVLSTGASVIHA